MTDQERDTAVRVVRLMRELRETRQQADRLEQELRLAVAALARVSDATTPTVGA